MTQATKAATVVLSIFLSAIAFSAAFGEETIVKLAVANLNGVQEVPALVSDGGGGFRAEFGRDPDQIDYDLSYKLTEGEVTQAHIHIGQRSVNGGVVVFLCSNLGNGPQGTQACPPAPATISGTITAADVLSGAEAQGIGEGELDKLRRAMVRGVTYVNVHTDLFPAGEIRGQIGTRTIRRFSPRLSSRVQ